MQTKRKAIDLIAYKEGKAIAFEIETGKNTSEQIIENISKCLNANIDKIYLVATNKSAFNKIRELLDKNNIDDERLFLVKAK